MPRAANNPYEGSYYINSSGWMNGRRIGDVLPINPSSLSYNKDMPEDLDKYSYKAPTIAADGVKVIIKEEEDNNPGKAALVDVLFLQQHGSETAVVACIRLHRKRALELRDQLQESNLRLQ